MAKLCYRTPEDVFSSLLWPGYPITQGQELDFSGRYAAILEVLSRISDPDFEKFAELADTFYWFIPDPFIIGLIFSAPLT